MIEHYIAIPKQLIIELRKNALAIALYFFIARLYLVKKQPVPLSRGDIMELDPSATDGAIKRALDHLVREGWLEKTVRHKASYTPTWGRNRYGKPHHWQVGVGAVCLGCPWEVWRDAIRVDKALLDLFIGRFRPHPTFPFCEGYFTDNEGQHKALLQFKDIGIYILIKTALPASPTEALKAWGLVTDGRVNPIPSDTIMLACASQHALSGGFKLAEAAWRRLNWSGGHQAKLTGQEPAIVPPDRAHSPTVPAAPLIFVSKDQIGALVPDLVGNQIGCSTSHKPIASASESYKSSIVQDSLTMTGISLESNQTRDTPPNPPYQGGGMPLPKGKKSSQGIQLPDTESARLLFAFEVHDPNCIVELATMPPEQVGGVIAYAKLHDLGPGWVVTELRRYRDEGWPIAQIRERRSHNDYIDVAAVMSGQFGDLIRLGGDTSDLDNREQRLVPPGGQLAAQASTKLVPPGASAAAQGQAIRLAIPNSSGKLQGASRPAARSSAELSHELRCALRMRFPSERDLHRLINGLVLRVDGERSIIHCASLADRLLILGRLTGDVRSVLSELGVPTFLDVTDNAPPPERTSQSSNGLPLSA